jgi:hypothetical protein
MTKNQLILFWEHRLGGLKLSSNKKLLTPKSNNFKLDATLRRIC